MEKQNYMDAKEAKFREVLAAGDTEATVAYFKETVIGSYTNGIRAGRRKADDADQDSETKPEAA